MPPAASVLAIMTIRGVGGVEEREVVVVVTGSATGSTEVAPVVAPVVVVVVVPLVVVAG